MSTIPWPNFIGPSYRSQSPVADAERCVNYYVEIAEAPGAKGRMFLYPTPGVQVFASVSDSPGRAFKNINGRVFAIIGPTLYELLSTGATINRGTVLTDPSPATIWGNGDVADQLFITSAGASYIFNLNTNVLSPVAIGALTRVDMGAYLDGYFMALDRSTSAFAISNLADGTTWNALQFQQRNAFADHWQTILVANRDVVLIGSETTDIWQDTGAQPFPFQPVPGANIEWGTAAPFSAAILGSPVWLGASRDGTGIVLQLVGYAAKRISTHAVERAIQSYPDVSDAVGWVYQEDGHLFYVLSFPSAQATWCYDAATQLWHERMYWDVVRAEEQATRQQWHVYAFGQHLVLDRATGTIHTASITLGSDVDGAAIRRMRRVPHVQALGRPMLFLHNFEVDLENGLGLPVGQGSDPMAMLRMSHDGARTWSAERWTSVGKQGNYLARVQWNQLGSGRDNVAELTMSDPIPWRLIGASLDYTQGFS
jgi:hypothetical protein